MKKIIRRQKPAMMTFSVADRLSMTGQRLRAGEAAVSTTFVLSYSARRAVDDAARRAGRR